MADAHTAIDNTNGLAQRQAQRIARLMADDAQFRNAVPLDRVNGAKTQPGLSVSQIMAAVFEGYADRPAVGQRATELIVDPISGCKTRKLLPSFDTLTYGEIWQRVRALANVWHHDAAMRIAPGDLVCILAFADPDFVVVDLATVYLGGVPVPLQTNATVAQLQGMLEETEPRCLTTTINNLEKAVDIVCGSFHPASIVVFNYVSDDDEQRAIFDNAKKRLAEAGIAIPLFTLEDLYERGTTVPSAPMYVPPPGENPLRTIYYTSGSTGAPKGAMYTENMFKLAWLSQNPLPVISILYQPMNHSMGRAGIYMTLGNGGTCYFTAKDDISTLFEDIQLVRPTSLSLVPRIVEMIFQQFQREVDRRRGESTDIVSVENAVMTEMREVRMGGRVLSGSAGSAPLSDELRAFIERCLDYRMDEGYGATEIVAFSHNGRVLRPPVIDYKLVDVPELGYFTTDKPYPRGELYVKTHTVMAGYYKRPDVTASVFDADGYYKTGDIMAEIEPDYLKYVDRRNNILKLSQGEFVAIAKLESIFLGHDPLIKQIFLYGTSARAFLLAVIVPNPEMLSPSDTEADIKQKLRDAIKKIADTEDLQAYEVPRDFLIEHEPFTAENGLLAGVGKVLRPALKARYGERLEELYDNIANHQANELRALRETARNAPVLATLGRAVQAVLGIENLDPDQPHSFRDLGGDSLSALSFSLLLEETFEVEVPVGVIADPTRDLRKLAQYIEKARASTAGRPTVASVHGRGATEIHACDLTLEKFIDIPTLDKAKTLPPLAIKSERDIRTVLVTGANGFLGRFLCLEWLERMARVGGKVICIARGRNNDDARQRIADVFDSGDEQLLQHFNELADAHLEVLAGDLSESQLGLADADWDRLAASVDFIVHPAALVNHVLPYAQLFGPNVVGTAELIRLALTAKRKAFCNVSTVAAALSERGNIGEDEDIRVAIPTRALDATHYAAGYASSKWAGEVLLRDAHERFGLPVSVFRSDMILPHSRWRGQLNKPDMFTRWLSSVIITGLAPASFYSGDRTQAHYDGLPVDFTAAAIATLAAQSLEGYRTYHVVNPHDDGISMDTFIDWARAAGHSIQRIDDYQDWVRRFEAALRALPEKQRQQSSLALIHQLRQPMPVHTGAVSARRFREDVRRCGVGAERDIPHLNEPFIRKYLQDLQHLALI